MEKFKALLFVLISFFFDYAAESTQFRAIPIQNLVYESFGVVYGQYLEQKAEVLNDIPEIVTKVSIRPTYLNTRQKIDLKNGILDLYFVGGTVGNLTRKVAGAPHFDSVEGDVVLFFGRDKQSGRLWIQGLSLGKFNVKKLDSGEKLLVSSIFPKHSHYENLTWNKLYSLVQNHYSQEWVVWTKAEGGDIDFFTSKKVIDEKKVKESTSARSMAGLKKEERPNLLFIILIFISVLAIPLIIIYIYRNNKRKKRILFSLLWVLCIWGAIFPTHLNSYVRTTNSTGKDIYWLEQLQTLYVNTSNSSGLSHSEVWSQINSSIQEWTTNGAYPLWSLSSSSGNNKTGKNNLYFSNNYSFSSGVLAYTSLTFEGNSGRIIEADIVINDNISFTTDRNAVDENVFFLGDILTHEFGHIYGIGHGQVRDSSMIYSVFSGQYSIAKDDKIGIKSNRLLANDKGTIKGKVIGSKNLVPVFGSHIQIISTKNGRVIAGAFSGNDGKFEIKNLDLEDTYYLYISPVSTDASPPEFFNNVLSSFCANGDYRGSFFSTCDARDEGFPQGIYLDASERVVDVGNISIHCQLSAPPSYMVKKKQYANSNNEYELDLIISDEQIGNAMVGNFSPAELTNSVEDVVSVDVSDVEINGSNYYLDIKLISQDLYSFYQNQLTIYKDGAEVSDLSEMIDDDGNRLFNLKEQINLSRESEKNKFELRIRPMSLSASTVTDITEIFPAYSSLKDVVAFYLLVVTIVEKDTLGNDKIWKRRSYKPYQDNTSCPDASRTYMSALTYDNSGISNINSTDPLPRMNKQDEGFLTCGTIYNDDDDDLNGSHQGGGKKTSILLSFLLGFLIVYFLGKRFSL